MASHPSEPFERPVGACRIRHVGLVMAVATLLAVDVSGEPVAARPADDLRIMRFSAPLTAIGPGQ